MSQEKEQNQDNNTPFQRFLRLLYVDRKDLYTVYIYAVLNGLIYLSVPLGIQAIINLIQGGEVNSAWVLMVFIVLLGIAITGILQILQLSLVETLQQRIFVRSSFELAYRIPHMSWEKLKERYLPELVNRFFDTLTVQKGLSKILFDFSTAAIQILFGLLLLAFYHPFFIGFALALLLILYLIFRFTVRGGIKTSLQESTHKYEVAYWLEELARTVGIFKINPSSNLPMFRTESLVNQYVDARKKHFKVLLVQYANMVAFKVIVAAGLLLLGGVLVFQQEMTLGQFVAAEIIILLIINSTEKLILSIETIYDVLTAIEKIGQVTDIPLESTEGKDLIIADEQKGMSVSVRNFSFQATEKALPILDNISVAVKAGERIGIIGPPGAGKSTFLYSLAGFYDSFDGQIFYEEDQSLRTLQLDSLRSQIGFNFAEEQIFNGTIWDNIIAGRPHIHPEYCKEVIHQVGLRPFIQDLKFGLNTRVTPEGANLSGGVRRKIVLCRAMAGKPKLLLFEDNLQVIPEYQRQRIYSYMARNNAPWTLIVSSNNKDLLEKCDRIFVFDDGKIEFEGKFQDVLKNVKFKTLIDA